MKVPITTRTISISIAAVATAFVCGMAVTSHQQTVAPFLGSYKAASTTTTDPSTTTAQVSTTAPTSTTTPSTTTTAPSTPLAAASPSSSTNLSTNTSSTTTTSQAAVTAVSAALGDWTAPVPDKTLSDTTDSYKYCLFTYSDGTTRRVLYQAKYISQDGVVSEPDPVMDCVLSAAPAGN